jgi:hypothetical protein
MRRFNYLTMFFIFTLSVLCLTGLQTSAQAATGSLSGSAVPIPDNPRLDIGDQTLVSLQLFNFSVSTEPDPNFMKKIAVGVDTASLIMSCEDSDCFTEIPGTMTFLGCENLNPCVTSCSLIKDNNLKDKQVDFNLNNCSIAPGGNIALGDVRLRLDNLDLLPDGANRFFIGGRATYQGSAGTCMPDGTCDNAQTEPEAHTCSNDLGCDWSDLASPATGSADILLPVCGDGIIDDPDETCDPPGVVNLPEETATSAVMTARSVVTQ